MARMSPVVAVSPSLGEIRWMLCLCAGVPVGHRVGGQHDVVAVLVRGPGGRLDPGTGRDPGQHDLGDTALAQQRVQRGAVERAPGLLGHQQIIRLLVHLRDDVGPVRRRSERRTADVSAAGRDARHVDQHDWEAVPAEGRGQVRRPLDGVIDGGHPGHGRDSLLRVDHDQRGLGVQGGQGHRAPLSQGDFRWWRWWLARSCWFRPEAGRWWRGPRG